MVCPSVWPSSKSEPLFQRNFFPYDIFSTKKENKLFVDGSLKTAEKYLSFKTNRFEKYGELQKWCAPHFWLPRKRSRFFSATFLRINFSQRKVKIKCSLIVLWKLLRNIYHLKQTALKNIENSRKGAPLKYDFFWKRATFWAQLLFKRKTPCEKGTEYILSWLSG